jgi:hypothetical protein
MVIVRRVFLRGEIIVWEEKHKGAGVAFHLRTV